MHTVDSQLVPAILLVMVGPIVMFLLWVFFSLHREIQRSRSKRVSLSRVTDLRGHVLFLRRVHHQKRSPSKSSITNKTMMV